MALDHLRLRHPIRIDAVERIEDEIAVIAGRPIAGRDRIKHIEILDGDKDQLVRPVRAPDPRRGKSRDARTDGFKQLASEHK